MALEVDDMFQYHGCRGGRTVGHAATEDEVSSAGVYAAGGKGRPPPTNFGIRKLRVHELSYGEKKLPKISTG